MRVAPYYEHFLLFKQLFRGNSSGYRNFVMDMFYRVDKDMKRTFARYCSLKKKGVSYTSIKRQKINHFKIVKKYKNQKKMEYFPFKTNPNLKLIKKI